jgi:hypothetical protein
LVVLPSNGAEPNLRATLEVFCRTLSDDAESARRELEQVRTVVDLLIAALDDAEALTRARGAIEERCALVIRAPREQNSVAAGEIELF